MGAQRVVSSSEYSQALPHIRRMRRVAVIGTSGSGKSTLARALAERLGVAAVELDAIRHGPNWQETPDDVFRMRVAEALAGDVWVVDGNYSVTRDLIWERATTLIWLDYPFPLVFWRLFWRTMIRGVLRKRLWNGNREDLWRHFLTRDSLFLWAAQTHWRRRKTLPIALAQPQDAAYRAGAAAIRPLAGDALSQGAPNAGMAGGDRRGGARRYSRDVV